MLMLLLNTQSWVAETIFVVSIYFITCWAMAANSLQHSERICVDQLGISVNSAYYPECMKQLGGQPMLFALS